MSIYGPGGRKVHASWLLLALGVLWASQDAASGQDHEEAARRMAELRSEIARHDELYFKRAQPEIADADYDRLKRELQSLESRFPHLAGPPAPLGDDRSGRFPSAAHRRRMLSLEKAYTEAEWRAFHARVSRQAGLAAPVFVVEPKYDGLAISLTYERGRLVRAVTRGNGREGEDVTANLVALVSPPAALDERGGAAPTLVELHGEVYADDAEFARVNLRQEKEGREPYAHPRNLAVGTLKSTDVLVRMGRRLSLVVHGWGTWEGGQEPGTEREFARLVASWGLPAVRISGVASSVGEVWRTMRELEERRDALGFPIDGAVVKLDDVALRRVLGESDQAPRWALAWKFSPARAIAKLRAIALQVGRTGVITPVAEFDPVVLRGARVTRATLHNPREIARLDVRLGDFVEVERAGDVIPAIVRVVLARREHGLAPYVFPADCPSCGVPLSLDADRSGARCPNTRCPAQVQRRLEHFASQQAVGLAGFGPAVIASLVKAGPLQSPADFYRLRLEELLSVKGAGKGTARRLLASVEASKQAELWRVISGLSIPSVGPVAARQLADRSGSLASFARLSRAELVDLIGPAAGEKVAEYLARSENQADLRVMIGVGLGKGSRPAGRPGVAGKVFVFSGSIPGLTREEATRLVEAAGGMVKETVSRHTDFLVVGERPGTKRTEAMRLGVAVLAPADFAELLGRP